VEITISIVRRARAIIGGSGFYENGEEESKAKECGTFGPIFCHISGIPVFFPSGKMRPQNEDASMS